MGWGQKKKGKNSHLGGLFLVVQWFRLQIFQCKGCGFDPRSGT